MPISGAAANGRGGRGRWLRHWVVAYLCSARIFAAANLTSYVGRHVGWIGWFTVLHCSFVSRWRCVQRSMPQPQDLKLKFPVLIVAWLLRITTLTSALCRRITWSRQTIGHYYIIQANTTAWRHSVVVIKTADSLVDRLKLARRLCFKRPLLLVDVSVWSLSVCRQLWR